MPYGFVDKSRAEELAARLREEEPQCKFEVAPHSWNAGLPIRFSDGSINELAARSWGVMRWAPYCEAVPWRNDGFVWF